MTRRLLFIFVLILTGALYSWGQEPADLVVILDTSASMSSSYTEVSDYLTGPFLREQLHIGDTFHLISFSAVPALELSRRIEGRGDIQTIVGRLLILYPVNPDTDVVSALEFGRRYTAGLPQGRAKKVFFISDGDHGISAGAYAGISADEARRRIGAASGAYRSLGAEFHYIEVPLSASRAQAAPASQPGSPQSSVPDRASPSSTGGQANPPPAGTRPPSSVPEPSGPDGQSARSSPPAEVQPPGGQSPSEEPSSPVPQPETPGAGSGSGTSQPPRDARADGSGESSMPRSAGTARPAFDFSIPLPLIIGLIAAALIALAVILIVKGRRLQSSPNRAMAQAASGNYREEDVRRTRDNAALLASYAASQRKGGSLTPPAYRRPVKDAGIPANGPMMLSLFVEDQNTAIGKRNIHTVKPGYTFSVGGKRSDFLIFLVPIPAHIADVSFDGKDCTFIPRKAQYFPDLGSSRLPNCIGENIRVISDKNYELHIRIERYQDPLITLNRMLRSIELPGLPDF